MTIGFRISSRKHRVDPALCQAFKTIPVATVGDCMARMFGAGAGLMPFHAQGRMAGPALTVRTRPGDNLMLHKAIDLAVPGDVIVVDGGGDLTTALMGGIMLEYAISRGVAGFVVHGAVRDADEIRAAGLPFYAAGISHRGPYKDGPGEINQPIALGGMVIAPGDLILGDGDGVLAVAYDDAPALLPQAKARQKAEAADIAAIRQGRFDRAWVDARLAQLGCQYQD